MIRLGEESSSFGPHLSVFSTFAVWLIGWSQLSYGLKNMHRGSCAGSPSPAHSFNELFSPNIYIHVMIRLGEESRSFGPRLSVFSTFAVWLIGWSKVSYGLRNMHRRSCAGSPSPAHSFNEIISPILCIHVMIRFGQKSRLFGPRLSVIIMMFLYVRQ